MKQQLTHKSLLWSGLLLMMVFSIMPSKASALTISEVVKDLACPCECPLILEDCNMSCGLEWKEEVGEQIKKGMNKEQIMEYFISKYGEDARLTPLQRIHGKTYQYTRSFDTVDWTLLWTGIIVWLSLMFFGVYISIRKLFFSSSQTN
jgi:cytochrome c-type biogenesis protein CcmH/NrfF